MKIKMTILTAIAATAFSCVPADKEGIPESQGYYHDSYYNLFIEGRVQTSGTASWCENGWMYDAETRQITCNGRTTGDRTISGYSYDYPTGPLPIEPLIGTLEKICLEEFREKKGVFEYCSRPSGNIRRPWTDTNINVPATDAGASDLYKENFCGQQMLLCVGHRLMEMSQAAAPVPFEGNPLDVRIIEIEEGDWPEPLPDWLVVLMFETGYTTYSTNNTFTYARCLVDNDRALVSSCMQKYLVPPQSAENRTLLLLAAVSAFRESVVRGLYQLNSINGIDRIADPAVVYGEIFELLDEFMTSHVEVVNAYIESLQKIIENQVAVSASYAGTNPDLASAREIEWNGPINSRSVALRLLYDSEPPLIEGEGGEMLPTSTYFSVVDVDPRKKEVRNAINLIRSLGIKIPSGDALEGEALVGQVEGSIARAFYEDRCWLVDVDDDPALLLGKLQIEEDDLLLAVRYLQQEAKAFLRPEEEIPFVEPDYPFPCDPLVVWSEIHEPRYSSTRNLPWQVPVRYYITRYATYPYPIDLVMGLRESLIHTANRSFVKIGTQSILGLFDLGTGVQNHTLPITDYEWAIPAVRYTPLVSTASQQAANIAGKFKVIIIYGAAHSILPRQTVYLDLYGDAVLQDKPASGPESVCPDKDMTLEEKLMVVQPADPQDETTRILQCVLTKSVEGQRCDVEDLSILYSRELRPLETCSTRGSGLWIGYRRYRLASMNTNYPAYVFRMAGSRPPELIAMWTPSNLSRAREMFLEGNVPGAEYVLGGEMEDWAQDILQRSINDAGRIAVGEIAPPLENEIIGNSNEYEDSWRHYLDVAKESAAKADELGEQIIQAGLEMDLRAEAALDELEEICGGVMNVSQLPCDPADPACEPPATCNGADISGCSNITLGGSGAGEGGTNPSLSSCLPGGKKARKADYMALGPEMCFWLDMNYRLCGPDGVVWSGAEPPGRLPPCPIPKTEEGCTAATFPISPASGAFFVVLGQSYALNELDETVDEGVWVPETGKPADAPKGWRLRAMGIFDPSKENADPPNPPPAPVCETIKILHRGDACLGTPSPTGEMTFIPGTSDATDCGSKGGTWHEEGGTDWQDTVNMVINHLRDEQGGWLSKQGLARALAALYLDSDLAHHYQLYMADKLVFSTYQRDQEDFGLNNLLKILDTSYRRGIHFVLECDPGDEMSRQRIGHDLQDMLLMLGFLSGEVTNIAVGFAALGEPEVNTMPYLEPDDYLYNHLFDSWIPWYSSNSECTTGDNYSVVVLEDPSLKMDGEEAQCRGDESCRCLYCTWPSKMDWDKNRVREELQNFISSPDHFYYYDDMENIPCIYGEALSVRDECVVHFSPDTPSEMRLEAFINDFGDNSFWNQVLRSSSSESYLNVRDAEGFNFIRDKEACEVDTDSFTSPDTLLIENVGGGSERELTYEGDEIERVTWKGPSSRDHFFWALELACAAIQESEGSIQCADFDPEEITKYEIDNVNELHLLTGYLQCAANAFYEAGSRIVVAGVPESVIKNAQTDAMEINQGEYGGEMLQAVNAIEQDLENLVRITQDIGFELSAASQHVETFRLEMNAKEIRDEIEQLRNTQSYFTHCASMLSSIGQAIGAMASAATSFGVSAGACGFYAAAAGMYGAAAVVDLIITSKTQMAQDYEWAADFNKMQEDLLVSLANLRDLYRSMGDTMKALQNDLEAYDRLQRRAQSLLAKATFADSDAAGRVYNVNTVMRRRLNTLQARYDKQLEMAKKAARRALKAVEFRTGIKLSSETQDMDLIPAPSTWVDKLDRLQGIDYSRIRCVPAAPSMVEGQPPQAGEGADTGNADSPCMSVDNYAEEFIGDWVTLLEGYMESYSAAHSFSDGEDYAVISLRDDLFGVTEICSIETDNLFYFSEDLSRFGKRLGPEERPDPDATVGWKVTGCPEAQFTCQPDNPDICEPSTACLTVTTSSKDALPCGYQQDDVTGDRVRYDCGRRYSEIVDTPGQVPYPGKVVQVIENLPRGTYLMAWFDKVGRGYGPPEEPPSVAHPYLVTFDLPGEQEDEWVSALSFQVDEDSDWNVKRIILRVEEGTDVRVGIDPSLSETQAGAIALTALQLVYLDVYERGDSYFNSEEWTDGGILDGVQIPGESKPDLLPRPYESTGSSRLQPGLCPDMDGDSLREMFAHKCDYLCRDGLGERECMGEDPNAYPLWCYYEIPFHISLEELETGELVPSGAIAVGNFNFRHIEVGLNIVGTNVIDCTETSYPSTCYTNAFLQYSLQHGGSFSVRNHLGEDMAFYLPSAWIEHQKALSTETVLTNPPTGSQRDLLTDYMNREFWGRPLTGDYLLKIWDAEGLFWPHVEDVQIALRYRYWTRHTQ